MRSGIKYSLTVIFLFLVLWAALRWLLPFCMPFLIGAGLALAAEPLVKVLCGPLHLPRSLGSGIGVTAVSALAAALVLSIAALILQQLKALAGILPDLEGAVRTGITLLETRLLELARLAPVSIRPLLRQNLRDLFSGSTALLTRAMEFILGLAGGMLTHIPGQALSLWTALLSAFMISAKLPRLRPWLREQLSRDRLQGIFSLLERVRTTLGRWLLAQLKLTGVTWLLLTGGFILIAIPYAPLWAMAVAALDALPVLGTGTVLIPWGIIAFLQGNRAKALGLLSIYLTVYLTRSVLEPRMVGRHLGLDPLLTLAALYAGFRLWGVGGMILAPLLAVTAAQLFPKEEKPPRFET